MLFSAVPGALFVCIHVSTRGRKEANDQTSPMTVTSRRPDGAEQLSLHPLMETSDTPTPFGVHKHH